MYIRKRLVTYTGMVIHLRFQCNVPFHLISSPFPLYSCLGSMQKCNSWGTINKIQTTYPLSCIYLCDGHAGSSLTFTESGCPLAVGSRLLSSRGAPASHCSGPSCCRARALRHSGFSSCGTWAWLPCGMWNLPRPGVKPTPSALAGRLLTAGPPGRSPCMFNPGLVADCAWCLNAPGLPSR